jgi:hypothetical protein
LASVYGTGISLFQDQTAVIIKGGRELIADRGLFITKKRYAVNIFDLEGKRA